MEVFSSTDMLTIGTIDGMGKNGAKIRAKHVVVRNQMVDTELVAAGNQRAANRNNTVDCLRRVDGDQIVDRSTSNLQ